MKRLTLMMEHKQDHFNHDIRKKERETLQMKERLSKKIMEKKTEKGRHVIRIIYLSKTTSAGVSIEELIAHSFIFIKFPLHAIFDV